MAGKLCLLFNESLRKVSWVSMGPETPQNAETRGWFIQSCNKSVSQGWMLMFPDDGSVAEETPEFGGRKFRVVLMPPDVGPWYFGDLEPKEAVRNERYWPTLGM